MKPTSALARFGLFAALAALPVVALPRASAPALPLRFEENRGQAPPEVRFLARGAGGSIFLTKSGPVWRLPGGNLRMTLDDSDPSHIRGEAPIAGSTHYLLGNSPKDWVTGVPTFERVKYSSLIPGVDLVFYGNDRLLEYDVVVAPGVSARALRFSIHGAGRLRIGRGGDLIVEAGGSEMRHRPPLAWQEAGGARRMVAAKYRLLGGNRFGFEIGDYDQARKLIIDPVLAFSTYFGGDKNDQIYRVATDSAGNIYVAGSTESLTFPLTPQTAVGATKPGGLDGFVAKFDPTGRRLLYATYLGGAGSEEINGLAVDSAGNAYIAGATNSDNFPVTQGSFQPVKKNGDDAFVAKIGPTGANLIYSTYLGGGVSVDTRLGDVALAIAVDPGGNAYVTGGTFSSDFPATPNAFRPANNGLGDIFVTKLNAAGTMLAYSAIVGGSFVDRGYDIAVDNEGNAYVLGNSSSDDFSITRGAFQISYGGGGITLGDAVVFKLNASGTALVYSTYLGGNDIDVGYGIAVDRTGAAYVTGATFSLNFPATNGVAQVRLRANSDVFVTKLNPQGNQLVYSTYFGGLGDETGIGIVLDSAGTVYVTGWTDSADFRTTGGAIQAAKVSAREAFLLRLDQTAANVLYATYLGGNGDDIAGAIAFDNQGNILIAGRSDSTSFPTANAYQGTNRGLGDAFLAKIDPVAGSPAALTVDSGNDQKGAVGKTLAGALVVLLRDSRNNPVAGVSVAFSATGGSVDPATAATDGAGQASTKLTLGATPGPVRVTATVTGIPALTFTATAEAAPVVSLDRVVNGGSFGPNTSPGVLITAFGTNFAIRETQPGTDPLPTEVDGVSLPSVLCEPHPDQRPVAHRHPARRGNGGSQIGQRAQHAREPRGSARIAGHSDVWSRTRGGAESGLLSQHSPERSARKQRDHAILHRAGRAGQPGTRRLLRSRLSAVAPAAARRRDHRRAKRRRPVRRPDARLHRPRPSQSQSAADGCRNLSGGAHDWRRNQQSGRAHHDGCAGRLRLRSCALSAPIEANMPR